MHFGENQLSRNLIGLSPPAPGHPPGFQPRWVRSSTRSYPRFNLPRARSSRFGSRTHDTRLLRLAFATRTPHGLRQPHATDSQTHFSIGTPSPRKAPTVCRRAVSGTLSLPSRGAFHLSLTVLVRYRSDGYTQAHPTVGADSRGIPRGPRYLGHMITGRHAYGYGAITLHGPAFNPVRLTHRFITHARPVGTGTHAPTTPATQPPTGITRSRFGHHPLSLATTHGVSIPAGTEMFHFPAYPPHKSGAIPSRMAGSPIRTPSDQSPLGGSPRPIAARRVLHRYRLPRHPPHAHARNPHGHAHKPIAKQPGRLDHHTDDRKTINKTKSFRTPTQKGGARRNQQQDQPEKKGRPCSRPLSSSQTTTTPATPSHTHTRAGPGHGATDTHPHRGGRQPGNPKACPYHPRPPTTDRRTGQRPFLASNPTRPDHPTPEAHDGRQPSS